MGELCKRTEEWRVADEAEAKALIEKAKALLDELFLKSGKINITIAGRGNINNWGGKSTPQILLDEMEIKECSEEDF